MPTGRILARHGAKLPASLVLVLALVTIPSAASASTVADCFKTVAGYNAFTSATGDVVAAVTLAVEHPDCASQIMSLDPYFEALTAAMILGKEAKVFSARRSARPRSPDRRRRRWRAS